MIAFVKFHQNLPWKENLSTIKIPVTGIAQKMMSSLIKVNDHFVNAMIFPWVIVLCSLLLGVYYTYEISLKNPATFLLQNAAKFYYKIRQFFITKCIDFSSKCGRYSQFQRVSSILQNKCLLLGYAKNSSNFLFSYK